MRISLTCRLIALLLVPLTTLQVSTSPDVWRACLLQQTVLAVIPGSHGPGIHSGARVFEHEALAPSGIASSQHPLEGEPQKAHLNRVLVAEDEPDVLIAIFHFLKEAGYSPISVDSAELARDLFFDFLPKLVITEWDFADGISGPELIREVRELDAGLPIILIDSHPDRLREKSAMLQVIGLQAPFLERELSDAIARALSQDGTAAKPVPAVPATVAATAAGDVTSNRLLTPEELKPLRQVIKAAREIFTRDEIAGEARISPTGLRRIESGNNTHMDVRDRILAGILNLKDRKSRGEPVGQSTHSGRRLTHREFGELLGMLQAATRQQKTAIHKILHIGRTTLYRILLGKNIRTKLRNKIRRRWHLVEPVVYGELALAVGAQWRMATLADGDGSGGPKRSPRIRVLAGAGDLWPEDIVGLRLDGRERPGVEGSLEPNAKEAGTYRLHKSVAKSVAAIRSSGLWYADKKLMETGRLRALSKPIVAPEPAEINEAMSRIYAVARRWQDDEQKILLSADRFTKPFKTACRRVGNDLRRGTWQRAKKYWFRRWNSVLAFSELLEVLWRVDQPRLPLRPGVTSVGAEHRYYGFRFISSLGELTIELKFRTTPSAPYLRIKMSKGHRLNDQLHTFRIGFNLPAKDTGIDRKVRNAKVSIYSNVNRDYLVHGEKIGKGFSTSHKPEQEISAVRKFFQYLMQSLDAAASAEPPSQLARAERAA